ncbi:hypothetical protein C0993_010826 [Termitomyces sp. T159_Od127]|nr:hypothetical protein C0993_010826 [Termitomyces sp. T159_Od127]
MFDKEKLVKLTQLEENKTKMDMIELKCAEQAAFSADLEAKLKKTALKLQETQFALHQMGCKKDALIADSRAKLEY